jgi:hypothetical protein
VLERGKGPAHLGDIAQTLRHDERVFERERRALADVRPQRVRRITEQTDRFAMPGR